MTENRPTRSEYPLSYAPDRVRFRAPWIAFLLVPLLALAGVLVPTAVASAATGDVSGDLSGL